MQNIGLIGKGFVGTAFSEGMKHVFDIYVNDLKLGSCIERQNSSESVKVDMPIEWLVKNCSIIFICLPTPMNLDGSCDTSIVEDAISKIANISKKENKKTIAVIKSTVCPGTTKKMCNLMDCVFNPEFLREATFIEDFKNQDRIILGGSELAVAEVEKVYQKAYPHVEIIKTCPTSAEMVKYVANCFLATKVSFANEIYEICDKLNINYDEVIKCATRDERLGKSHWAVPGPDTKRGFGQKCFPKDLNALISLAEEIGVDPKVMSAVWEKNLQIRPERDWEEIYGVITK